MLLDTTLRDGSYVINFGFDAEQTTGVLDGLQQANIPMVEVGHGIGLNASEKGLGVASQTDEEYMIAALETASTAKWGMFAIPGICELEHLDACIANGMDFIRIGVSIDDYSKAAPFVDKARKANMIACVNFMKSYSRPPYVFESAARDAIGYGADFVYIVDSAGNLTPDQTRRYCERITDIPFGFHGHDNLGLANANAFVAYAMGAHIIDCSLQGMGRSAGNTKLEQFVAILQQNGESQDVDLLKLIDTSEKYIRPLIRNGGCDGLDVICGFSGFHSSYMSVIREMAIKYEVDPRRLIIDLCEVTIDKAPAKLVEEIAEKLSNENLGFPENTKATLQKYFGDEQNFI